MLQFVAVWCSVVLSVAGSRCDAATSARNLSPRCVRACAPAHPFSPNFSFPFFLAHTPFPSLTLRLSHTHALFFSTVLSQYPIERCSYSIVFSIVSYSIVFSIVLVFYRTISHRKMLVFYRSIFRWVEYEHLLSAKDARILSYLIIRAQTLEEPFYSSKKDLESTKRALYSAY